MIWKHSSTSIKRWGRWNADSLDTVVEETTDPVVISESWQKRKKCYEFLFEKKENVMVFISPVEQPWPLNTSWKYFYFTKRFMSHFTHQQQKKPSTNHCSRRFVCSLTASRLVNTWNYWTQGCTKNGGYPLKSTRNNMESAIKFEGTNVWNTKLSTYLKKIQFTNSISQIDRNLLQGFRYFLDNYPSWR